MCRLPKLDQQHAKLNNIIEYFASTSCYKVTLKGSSLANTADSEQISHFETRPYVELYIRPTTCRSDLSTESINLTETRQEAQKQKGPPDVRAFLLKKTKQRYRCTLYRNDIVAVTATLWFQSHAMLASAFARYCQLPFHALRRRKTSSEQSCSEENSLPADFCEACVDLSTHACALLQSSSRVFGATARQERNRKLQTISAVSRSCR